VNRLSRENLGTSTSHTPMDLHGLLTGIILPYHWCYAFHKSHTPGHSLYMSVEEISGSVTSITSHSIHFRYSQAIVTNGSQLRLCGDTPQFVLGRCSSVGCSLRFMFYRRPFLFLFRPSIRNSSNYPILHPPIQTSIRPRTIPVHSSTS
jgi:hypothetical protein